jgi:hypothetical protein
MDKKKLPLLIAAVLLFLSVALFVYFSKDSYHTEVFYGDDISQQGTSSSRKKSSKKSTASKRPSSSKKNNSTSKPKKERSETDSVLEEDSEEYHYLYSTPEQGASSAGSDSDWEPLPEGSQEEEGTLSFTDVNVSANILEKRYGVKIYLHTSEQNQSVRGSYFTSPEQAQEAVDTLSYLLSLSDRSLLQGLSRRGTPLVVTLVESLPSQEQAVSLERANGGIYFLLQDGTKLEESFMSSLAEGCYSLLEQQGKLGGLEQEFQNCNPERFSYGKYLPQYVLSDPSSTYFLDVSSLLSMKNDLCRIYAAYYADLVGEEYFEESCPVNQKFQAMIQEFQRDLY